MRRPVRVRVPGPVRHLAAATALAAALGGGALVVAPGAGAQARSIDDGCPTTIRDGGFSDVPASNVHERAIDCIVWWEVTLGTATGRYAPADSMSRGQTASFIARLINRGGTRLPEPSRDWFDDDDGTTHEQNTNRLAEAGLVRGTGPASFSPSRTVNRAEVAALLVRAYQYLSGTTLAPGTDAFDDDEGSTHEPDINRAAAAGIAAGSGNRAFRPLSPVRRDEMASFTARVLDLVVEQRLSAVPVERLALQGSGDYRSEDIRLRSGDYTVTWAHDSSACSRVTTIAAADGDPIVFEDRPDDDGATSGRATITDVPADEYRVTVSTVAAGTGTGSCGWQLAVDRT